MNLSLPSKRYDIPIVSLIFLSFFFSTAVRATPACPIVTNQFQGTNGVTIDNSATGWSVDSSNLHSPHPTNYYFAIFSNRFTTTNLGGIGIINSKVFNIAGYRSPQVSVKITAEGNQDSLTEYVEFYYKLDGGSPVLVAHQKGYFGTLTFTSPVLSGSTVQLIIKVNSRNNGSGTKSNYYVERYDVFQTAGPCTPGTASIAASISASNGGALTCTNHSVTLTPSSSTSGLTYWWAGPNNFSTQSVNPSVSTAGLYTLTVTTATAWGTASYTVTTNTTAPAGVTAVSTNVLSCSVPVDTLKGGSSTSGVSFAWTGPSSFSKTGATVTTTAAGTYTVTATNPVNGCTASQTVAVSSVAGSVNAVATGGTLSCTNSAVTLAGSSTTSGATYSWTGPNGFTSPAQNPSVGTAGIYTLTVTNPANGCTGTDTANVLLNNSLPGNVHASVAGKITCVNMLAALSATSSTAGVTYSWSGPNGYYTSPNTSSAASTHAAGLYTVTVTNPASGCVATDTVTVVFAQDLAQNVAVSPSLALLNCTNPTQALVGSTTTAGVSYSWTGPNGYTATGPNAVATAAGNYVLQILDSASGCYASTTASIVSNFTVPANVAATTNGPLSCTRQQVTLTASSTTSNVNFSWTGPGNFSSPSSLAFVSVSGTYTLNTVHQASGCTGTPVTVVVGQDLTTPSNLSLVSGSGGTVLNCTNPSLTLNVSSAAASDIYNWSGPGGFSATGPGIAVTTPGSYSVTATNSVSGCTASRALQISQNISLPAAVGTSSVPANALLNCTQHNVVLTGSSATPGVSYSWSGPGGFSANTAVATATIPGAFMLTVTDPSNGCSSTATATVTQDIAAPASVTANPSSILTCAQTSINLTGNSTTAGVSYSWSGPSGFSSTARITPTTVPGAYVLTVTLPSSGCTATKSINVQQNITPPANVSIAPPDMLNCDVSSVNLTGSSTTANVLYIWSGPDDFSDVVPTTTVSEPGDYILTVTDLGNSCSSTATVTVEQDLTACEAVARKLASGQSATLMTDGSTTNQAGAGFRYKIYPNPVSNASFVHFTTPKGAHVQVVLYNSTGVREKILFDGRAEANQHYQLPVGADRMVPGVHFCIIRVDEKIYSQKLVLTGGRP